MWYCCGSIEGFIWEVWRCNELTNSAFVPFHAELNCKLTWIKKYLKDLKFQFQLSIFNKEAHLKLRESFGFNDPIEAQFDDPAAAVIKVTTNNFFCTLAKGEFCTCPYHRQNSGKTRWAVFSCFLADDLLASFVIRGVSKQGLFSWCQLLLLLLYIYIFI